MLKFSVKKPCKNCPFTSNKSESIRLRKGRREQIIRDLKSQVHTEFVCHKTLDRKQSERALCAGAVAVCRHEKKPMYAEEIAIRLGVIPLNHYDSAIDLSSNNYELGD